MPIPDVCSKRRSIIIYNYIIILVFFRAATAALVEKQSSEMLELINEKRSEYMMAESLYLDDSTIPDETVETLNDNVQPYPGKAPLPPSPHGVAQAKFQLYSDPLEFAHIDQIAISVRPIIK